VVTYNGADGISVGIDALRGQVGRILIVDNGSDRPTQDVLDALEQEDGIVVLRLGVNRGIGHALNRGIDYARESGFSWMLTMDQDSVVSPTFVAAFQRAVERQPDIRCLAPTLRPSGVGASGKATRVDYAITSGNLVNLAAFERVGTYDEGFFIDCIDFDFSLRLRRAGLAMYRVPDAVMEHQLGEASDLPKIVRHVYARHSPLRRYYMYRNFCYMVERHVTRFPGFIIKLAMAQVLLTILIGVYDTRPLETYRAIGRGLRDYLARRTGPMEQLAR
jgi:rhamnosyltransferase